MEKRGRVCLWDDLYFDSEGQMLYTDGAEQKQELLSRLPCSVMCHLALNAGKVCTAESIFINCWSLDAADKVQDAGAQVRRVISSLRKSIVALAPKIDAKMLIETRTGTGYCLHMQQQKPIVRRDYTMLSADDPYMREYNMAFKMESNGDYAGAYAVMHRLAQAGHAPSMCYVGVALSKGEGVERNEEKGLVYYIESAKLGYPAAQLNVGDHYMNPMGGSFDPQKAVEMYLLAAKNPDGPDPDAMYRLYLCYRDGRGIPADLEKAEYWRRCAEENGVTDYVDYYAKSRFR